MNRSELKKILKPLIKECIREAIFEEGVLSGIITEVVKGTTTSKSIVEQKQVSRLETTEQSLQRRKSKLAAHKETLLNSIGRDTYNGIDLFEGTVPTRERDSEKTPHGSKALDGVSPQDPGVDLTNGIWKKLAGN